MVFAAAPGVGLGGLLTNFLANAIGGSGRVYALNHDGSFVSGWPTQPNGILPDILPLVGPGVDHIIANGDTDAQPEVIGNVSTGDVGSTQPNGGEGVWYESDPQGGDTTDKSKVLNLFENPIAANIDSTPGAEIIKGGLTLNQAANLLAVGQNVPYNHVVQAWNAETGASLPAFPQAVDDYQLLSSPSVADVSDSPGNEILVGTGLYYLRSLNSQGIEGAPTDCTTAFCWPKFTGGWIYPTPAIGDTDGDGDLDITTLTREGHAFSWGTNRPACGTNDEWWTSRHDEWNTGAYGTDTRPPGAPGNLRVHLAGPHVLVLHWEAPGDDWLCGTATRYRVIASTGPIDSPTDGDLLGEFTPSVATGQTQAHSVSNVNTHYTHFAVLYQDDAGNWGNMRTTQLGADLALTQTDSPDPVTVGAPLTYTLEVTNNGQATTSGFGLVTSSGVTLTDTLPKNVRFRSARSNHGTCRQRAPRRIACNLGEFAAEETATVTIVVRPTKPGNITNTATVLESRPSDPNPSNNTDAESTQVVP